MTTLEILVTDTHEEASATLAGMLAEAARAGAQIALSGGSTPRPAYQLAAELEPDWSRATVWLVDERCVPPTDPASNELLLHQSLLDRLAHRPTFFPVPTHVGASGAADRYERLLRSTPPLELVALGIGPDGHTASLFPGSSALEETDRLVVATEAGLEPFVPRVTLTLPALAAAAHVVFLVTGAEKADAVRRAFGEPPAMATPASLARSANGLTTVVLDRAAACLHT